MARRACLVLAAAAALLLLCCSIGPQQVQASSTSASASAAASVSASASASANKKADNSVGLLLMHGVFKPPHKAHFELAREFLQGCVSWDQMQEVHLFVFLLPDKPHHHHKSNKPDLSISNQMSAVVWRDILLPLLQNEFGAKVLSISFFSDPDKNSTPPDGVVQGGPERGDYDVRQLARQLGLVTGAEEVVTARHYGELGSKAAKRVQEGKAVWCDYDHKWPDHKALTLAHPKGEHAPPAYDDKAFRSLLKTAPTLAALRAAVADSLPEGAEVDKATMYWKNYLKDPRDFSWLATPVPNIQNPFDVQKLYNDTQAKAKQGEEEEEEVTVAAQAKKREKNRTHPDVFSDDEALAFADRATHSSDLSAKQRQQKAAKKQLIEAALQAKTWEFNGCKSVCIECLPHTAAERPAAWATANLGLFIELASDKSKPDSCVVRYVKSWEFKVGESEAPFGFLDTISKYKIFEELNDFISKKAKGICGDASVTMTQLSKQAWRVRTLFSDDKHLCKTALYKRRVSGSALDTVYQ